MLAACLWCFAGLPAHAAGAAPDVPVRTVFTSYGGALSAAWMHDRDVVVGRLDGTLLVYRMEHDALRLQQALVTPTREAARSLTRLDDSAFVSSDGGSAFGLWARPARRGAFRLVRSVRYPAKLGPVTSGLPIDSAVLVLGHAEGWLSFWDRRAALAPKYLGAVDARLLQPPISSVSTPAVYGLARLDASTLLAATDEGGLVTVDLRARKALRRQLYNPRAQRGINGVAVRGEYLLVANCAVGEDDANLWLMRRAGDGFAVLDRVHLRAEGSQQTFALGAQFVDAQGSGFVVSTEKGGLWYGTIEADKLNVARFHQLHERGAPVLAYQPATRALLAAGRDLLLLNVK